MLISSLLSSCCSLFSKYLVFKTCNLLWKRDLGISAAHSFFFPNVSLICLLRNGRFCLLYIRDLSIWSCVQCFLLLLLQVILLESCFLCPFSSLVPKCFIKPFWMCTSLPSLPILSKNNFGCKEMCTCKKQTKLSFWVCWMVWVNICLVAKYIAYLYNLSSSSA